MVKDSVRNFLDAYGHITEREAAELMGVDDLAAVISELKNDGVEIEAKKDTINGKKTTVYKPEKGAK